MDVASAIADQRDADEALAEREAKLLAYCQKYFADTKITCAETVYQTDRVIESAYDFIAGIGEIIGWAEQESGGA